MRSARRESYLRLFLRFLRFGFLAWGGPVAQIAMIRQEFVEEERWIDRERFNRVLAVYQALPGPEATELCVYFGFVSLGRIGGLLAGLGFLLPGFALMFALSWFYVTVGIGSVVFSAVFRGMQPAVVALIVRAVQRIGQHALNDRWLWMMAVVAGIAEWLGAHFLLTLALAGLGYALVKRGRSAFVIVGTGVFLLATLAAALSPAGQGTGTAPIDPAPPTVPSLPALFGSGLRGGLLTFGGAYTAIPFLREDAVEVGRWMTDAQFLDGLALSGILPAPLIIFSTFIGYLGGGPIGALAVTVGVFLPAFGFTLIGYDLVERAVAHKALHALLDGVTAGVVGLIGVTAIRLVGVTIVDLPALCIFLVALLNETKKVLWF